MAVGFRRWALPDIKDEGTVLSGESITTTRVRAGCRSQSRNGVSEITGPTLPNGDLRLTICACSMSEAASRFPGDQAQSESGDSYGIRATPSNRIGYKSAVVLGVVLAAFVILQALLPLSTTIQIGADEGFELAKATLCLNGYRLYADVWNDQPPLHTFLITEILNHLSFSIVGPRLLTSVFTAILIASFFLISLRVGGLLIAAV